MPSDYFETPQLDAAVEVREDPEPEMGAYAAVLWVPDIEKPHGWREFYVKRKTGPTKPGQRMGF